MIQLWFTIKYESKAVEGVTINPTEIDLGNVKRMNRKNRCVIYLQCIGHENFLL